MRNVIRAIIFDCFGVLAEDGWTPFKRKYLEGNPEVALAVQLLGKDVDSGLRSYEDMITETARLAGVDKKIVDDAVGRQVPNEELFTYIRSELRSTYKIGMLSNAGYNVVESLFTPAQAALFDATVLSYEAGLVKPDERVYELIAHRLGVPIEVCVFIDDHPRHCDGAKDAGMQAILYENVAQLQQDLTKVLSKQ